MSKELVKILDTAKQGDLVVAIQKLKIPEVSVVDKEEIIKALEAVTGVVTLEKFAEAFKDGIDKAI